MLLSNSFNFHDVKLEDTSTRLLRLLKLYGDRIIIDNDGMVGINFENPDVKRKISRQLEALDAVKLDSNE